MKQEMLALLTAILIMCGVTLLTSCSNSDTPTTTTMRSATSAHWWNGVGTNDTENPNM